MTISIAINLDTRPGFMEQVTQQGTMLNGTRSLDFFTEGIKNKVRFFDGHDIETTVFIDVHEPLPKDTQDWLLNQQASGMIDNLVFNRHTEQYYGEGFQKFNDINFLNAMILTRGKYLCHFDGDMNAFIKDRSVIDEWLKWLDEGKYDFICYPSQYSPNPVVDPDFDYFWASTRFFVCKRDKIDYTEQVKCLSDSDYLYGKYGDRKRRCPWLEHTLALTNGPAKVFYPPVEPNRYLIFSWSRYYSGVLKKLNEWPYGKVMEYVNKISYPCDVGATPI
jgi:hypothetical protein